MAPNRSLLNQFARMMNDLKPYIKLWKEARVSQLAMA